MSRFFAIDVPPWSGGGPPVKAQANCGQSGPIPLITGNCPGGAPLSLAAYGTGAPLLTAPAAMECLSPGGAQTFPSETVGCASGGGAVCNGVGIGYVWQSPLVGAPLGGGVPPEAWAPAATWVVPLIVTSVSTPSVATWTDTWIILTDATGAVVSTPGHTSASLNLGSGGAFSMDVPCTGFVVPSGFCVVILLRFTFAAVGSFNFASGDTIISSLQWANQHYEAAILLEPGRASGSGSGSGGTLPVYLVTPGCGEYRLALPGAPDPPPASGSGSGITPPPLLTIPTCCPQYLGSGGSGTGTGVFNPCCPDNPIPETLFVPLTGALASLGTIALSYTPFVEGVFFDPHWESNLIVTSLCGLSARNLALSLWAWIVGCQGIALTKWLVVLYTSQINPGPPVTIVGDVGSAGQIEYEGLSNCTPVFAACGIGGVPGTGRVGSCTLDDTLVLMQ